MVLRWVCVWDIEIHGSCRHVLHLVEVAFLCHWLCLLLSLSTLCKLLDTVNTCCSTSVFPWVWDCSWVWLVVCTFLWSFLAQLLLPTTLLQEVHGAPSIHSLIVYVQLPVAYILQQFPVASMLFFNNKNSIYYNLTFVSTFWLALWYFWCRPQIKCV